MEFGNFSGDATETFFETVEVVKDFVNGSLKFFTGDAPSSLFRKGRSMGWGSTDTRLLHQNIYHAGS